MWPWEGVGSGPGNGDLNLLAEVVWDNILPPHPLGRGSLEVLSCDLSLVLLFALAALPVPECWRWKGSCPLALAC